MELESDPELVVGFVGWLQETIVIDNITDTKQIINLFMIFSSIVLMVESILYKLLHVIIQLSLS
jgi:hypothetical protein